MSTDDMSQGMYAHTTISYDLVTNSLTRRNKIDLVTQSLGPNKGKYYCFLLNHMSSQVPPGISQPLDYFASGNDSMEWLPLLPIKHYTVAHILQGDKVLLGYKKRGFAQGIYNGFGGKVEPNETSLQAAVRELEEEAGITAPLRHIGVLIFIVAGAEKAFHIDAYYAEEFEGTITETEEMRPEWFSLSTSDVQGDLPPIPWDKMWDTDRHWFPLLRDKRPFVGRVDFDKNENGAFILRRWWYGTIQ